MTRFCVRRAERSAKAAAQASKRRAQQQAEAAANAAKNKRASAALRRQEERDRMEALQQALAEKKSAQGEGEETDDKPFPLRPLRHLRASLSQVACGEGAPYSPARVPRLRADKPRTLPPTTTGNPELGTRNCELALGIGTRN